MPPKEYIVTFATPTIERKRHEIKNTYHLEVWELEVLEEVSFCIQIKVNSV